MVGYSMLMSTGHDGVSDEGLTTSEFHSTD